MRIALMLAAHLVGFILCIYIIDKLPPLTYYDDMMKAVFRTGAAFAAFVSAVLAVINHIENL